MATVISGLDIDSLLEFRKILRPAASPLMAGEHVFTLFQKGILLSWAHGWQEAGQTHLMWLSVPPFMHLTDDLALQIGSQFSWSPDSEKHNHKRCWTCTCLSWKAVSFRGMLSCVCWRSEDKRGQFSFFLTIYCLVMLSFLTRFNWKLKTSEFVEIL